MAGPPAGFEDYMDQKYAGINRTSRAQANLANTQASVMPGEAQARNTLLGAQANQTNQQADMVKPLAQSQIGEASARGGLYGAQAYQTGQQGNWVAPLAQASIGESLGRVGLMGAQSNEANAAGRNYDATAGNTAASTNDLYGPGGDAMGSAYGRGMGYGFRPGFSHGTDDVVTHEHAHAIHAALLARKGAGGPPAPGGPPKGHAQAMVANSQKGKGGGLAAILPALMAAGGGGGAPGGAAPQMPGGMGFFGGTNQVPGKGSGNVDKVPAMLAPHEAVLTKNAANALGRGKIAALNAANPPGSPGPKLPGKGLVKSK